MLINPPYSVTLNLFSRKSHIFALVANGTILFIERLNQNHQNVLRLDSSVKINLYDIHSVKNQYLE